MADWPQVSVITLNWNGLVHLESCFQSLLRLDYPMDQLELILVDNSSSDGSVEYIQRHFPGVKIIRNEFNLGFCRANNIGARDAKGKHVAFLNNDTRVHPDWLKEMVTAVERDPDTVCAASQMLSWDGSQIDFGGGSMNFHGAAFHPSRGEQYEADLAEPHEVLFACGGSMLIDRQVFLDCGGFDEDFFIFYEDVDLGWRLWVMGYRVVLVPRAITYHRIHGSVGGWKYEKMASITERNTLLSMIKNYSDENLARVLPAALMLMMERAFRFADTEGQRYRLDAHLRGGGKDALAVPSPANREGRKAKGAGVWSMIRQDGLMRVARRALRKGWRLGCRWFISKFSHELEAVPRSTIGILVAADDAIEFLPRILGRRRTVQRRRRRSDGEIFPLFRQPFYPAVRGGMYEQVQNTLVEAMGIQEMFDVSQGEEIQQRKHW